MLGLIRLVLCYIWAPTSTEGECLIQPLEGIRKVFLEEMIPNQSLKNNRYN